MLEPSQLYMTLRYMIFIYYGWHDGILVRVRTAGDGLLLIDHVVAPSDVDGLGVFATAFVANGARIYQFNPLIDREIPESELGQLPRHVIMTIHKHGDFDELRNVFRLSADGTYYMNHSDDPNVEDRGDEMFACRDILAGEELLCDYRVTRVMAFDPDLRAEIIDDPHGHDQGR